MTLSFFMKTNFIAISRLKLSPKSNWTEADIMQSMIYFLEYQYCNIINKMIRTAIPKCF